MKKIKPGCFDCANAVCDECDPNQYARGIGDINSNALGSGARYNAGKPALDLIPAKVIAETLSLFCSTVNDKPWLTALTAIGRFQMREADVEGLYDALAFLGNPADVWRECAAVFDYGRNKYAAWNWAKGMPWSVPIGCAMRHILFGPLAGEELDSESGLSHRGHVACNLVMLIYYFDHYPEGDDRPSKPETTV